MAQTEADSPADVRAPTVAEIAAAREQLGSRIRETPVWLWQSDTIRKDLGSDVEVYLKLELWQHAGSFKTRGAILNMLALSEEERSRGVTAVSAGNHAMATAFAARSLQTSAKVVMMENASPIRVQGCKDYGAEVILAPDVHRAFELTHQIEREEGRSFIHPFEGWGTALGQATLGWELSQQVQELDAVVIPIGGGGLCAGVAAAVKQMQPRCRVIGVEPVGADSMHRSFAAGKPEAIDKVRTIADSLGAPYAAPYSFGLCRRFVDELVKVDDDQICHAMLRLFTEMKLSVEPAGAAATAALWGPLRDSLAGARVALIVCGANLDSDLFGTYLERGKRVAAAGA